MADCTDMRFASFLSGGFTSMAVINPPEKKLAKRTSVPCVEMGFTRTFPRNQDATVKLKSELISSKF